MFVDLNKPDNYLWSKLVDNAWSLEYHNSFMIPDTVLDNWGELRQHSPMDTIRYQLKTMNRQYGLYTKNKTAFKNNLIALLDQTYPAVNALFDSPVRANGSQKW